MRPLLLIALMLPLLACPRRAETIEPPQPSAAETNPNTATQAAQQPTNDLEKPAVDAGPIAITNEEVPKVGRGETCTSDAQCEHGLVCEGCSDSDRKCIPGCRRDADCSSGEKCRQVQCIRCPCPPLCGS